MLWTEHWLPKKIWKTRCFRVVCPFTCFNISWNDISALEHNYAQQNRLYASFLTLNKMTIQFFQFSKFSNNLGIRSESSFIHVILTWRETFSGNPEGTHVEILLVKMIDSQPFLFLRSRATQNCQIRSEPSFDRYLHKKGIFRWKIQLEIYNQPLSCHKET